MENRADELYFHWEDDTPGGKWPEQYKEILRPEMLKYWLALSDDWEIEDALEERLAEYSAPSYPETEDYQTILNPLRDFL